MVSLLNQGYASGDTDNDGNIDVVVASQVRVDTINADYAVALTDTGTIVTGDADGTSNDDQLIADASAGSSVEFTGVLTNQGNTTDFYILSATNTNFPAGTVFTFYDAATGNSLGNSTQALAPNASTNILIRASLPAGVSGLPTGGATEFEAVITAISANDTNATAASNDMTISLGEILDAGSDIHIAANGQIGSDEDPLGNEPYATNNVFTGSLGQTINIPLFIDNESGGTDVFVLGAGSSWDGTTLGALPPGWTVQFFEADTNGDPINGPITSTTTLAANSVNNAYVAVVSIPNNAAQALPNVSWDNNGDAVLDVLTDNVDSDGDYPFFFQILSQNTGSSDIVLSAVDVDSTRELTLVGPGFKQTEAGGTVIYDHTLTNQGSVAEDVSIASSNSGAGWTSSVSIDTDGDGDADTSVNALPVVGAATDTIDVLSGGVVVTVTINDTDTDGIADSITVEPGVSLPISVAVFAPATATNGQTDFTTVTVSNIDTDPSAPGATVNNQTTIVSGNVSLVKTVAVDVLCDGEPDTAFDTIQATQIKPDECAIWQVVATNLGSLTTVNVIITDSAPLFTTFEAGSLEYCLGSNCDPDPILLPAANGGVGEYDAVTNAVKFYVGDNSSPQTGVGGELVSAQSATVRFRVKVD